MITHSLAIDWHHQPPTNFIQSHRASARVCVPSSVAVCGSILLPWWLRLVVDDNTALSQRLPHTLVSWALVVWRSV
jgi:hypothetical protein